jgi:hypothetical protein
MALPAGINATWLKTNYGGGLQFVDRAGVPLPTSMFDTQLCAAQEWVEIELAIVIGPRNVENDRYDVVPMSRPYFQQKVRYRPVRQATGARFRWGNNPQAQELPVQWLMVRQNRLIEIVNDLKTPIIPNNGILFGYSWPFFYWSQRAPGFLELDYTAGFDGVELPLPAGIANAIGLKAIMLCLVALSNSLFPPGTTNISRSQDGLSQSRGTTASSNSVLLGNMINEYQRQLDIQMATLRAQYGGSVKFKPV